MGFENIFSLVHIEFRTKSVMSKNNSKVLCILNFLFFWLAQRDIGHHHPSSTIYGHINYDMVNEPVITPRVNQKTKSLLIFS